MDATNFCIVIKVKSSVLISTYKSVIKTFKTYGNKDYGAKYNKIICDIIGYIGNMSMRCRA